jgi:hypothetical protein
MDLDIYGNHFSHNLHTVRFVERIQPLIDQKLDVTHAVPLSSKANGWA